MSILLHPQHSVKLFTSRSGRLRLKSIGSRPLFYLREQRRTQTERTARQRNLVITTVEDLDFLVQHGMSLDEIHRLVGDGIPLGEIVESAKRIVERGDPLTADAQQVPSPPKLTTISAVSLQQKNIPPVRWIM